MKNSKIKDMAKVLISKMTSDIPYEWPPSCLVFTYQPMRPEQQNIQCDNVDASKAKEDQ